MEKNSIQIIGGEGAFSDNSTAYLINGTILVDCSQNTVDELKRLGLLDGVNHLIFTHAHNDHIGGMSSFIEYKRYIQQDFDYTIYAGTYFMKHYGTLGCSVNHKSSMVLDFNYLEIGPEGRSEDVEIEGLNFHFAAVKHVNYNLEAISVNIDNKAFISGDIDDSFVPELNNLLHKDMTCIFIDMGWTGLPDVDYMVHPLESTVDREINNAFHKQIIGVHTSADLKVFPRVTKGDVFNF